MAATFRVFHTPREHALTDDVSLLVFGAGRDSRGYIADLGAENGHILHRDRFPLADAARRARFSKTLTGKCAVLTAASIDAALLVILDALPAELAHEETSDPAGHAPYALDGGRICAVRGDALEPLCNFTAEIIGDTVTDDGTTERGALEITGTLETGQPLGVATVSYSQFARMDWPLASWGPRARLKAGMGAKDQLREAIQLLSPNVARTVTYGHTGWRWIYGNFVYLFHGGAIGTDGTVAGITVSLAKSIEHAQLPSPPTGDVAKEAIRCSLALLDLAPAPIMAPVLGAAYRAPLCEVLQADLSVFLTGVSGGFKTELTVLAQQHYGQGFNRLNLPANWASTANALEKTASDCKDMVAVIDDFVPTGGANDVRRLHSTADRVFRGAGNHAGRGRMAADGSMRAEYRARGILLASGEDLPTGYSLGARLYVVPISRDDVRPDDLRSAQEHGDAGLYAQAMASYIQWLAPRLAALKHTLPARLQTLRDELADAVGHRRTPTSVAQLLIGWETWLTFAVDLGALTQEEAAGLLQRVRAGFQEGMGTQARHAQGQAPAQRFLELIRAAIASGRVHVAAPNGDDPDQPFRWGWRPRTHHTAEGEAVTTWQPADERQRIGYVEGESLFLLPEMAYSTVQQMAQNQQGVAFVQQRTLWKHLHEAGLLSTRDAKRERYTVRRMVAGARLELLHMQVHTVLGTEPPSQPSHWSQGDDSPEENRGEKGRNAGTVVSGDRPSNPRPSHDRPTKLPHPPEEHAACGTNGTVGTVADTPYVYRNDEDRALGFGPDGTHPF